MRIVAGIVLWLGLAGSAWAAFPYHYGGTAPNDLQGKVEWMYAATPEPGNTLVNADPRELGGVRGASLVDRDPSVETAWQTTTGRPDVTIAVLDSGIEWNDLEAMRDLRSSSRRPPQRPCRVARPRPSRCRPAPPGSASARSTSRATKGGPRRYWSPEGAPEPSVGCLMHPYGGFRSPHSAG